MQLKRILPIALGLIFSLAIFAEDKLYIEDFSVTCGTQVTVPVKMANENAVAAFQFDLALPTSVTLDAVSIDGPRTSSFDYEVDTNVLEDGSIRIACISINDAKDAFFSDNDGEVLYLTLNVSSESLNETEYLYLNNQIITEFDLTEIVPEFTTTEITILSDSFILGDVNDDKKVTVTDIACTASYILGTTPDPFIFKAADVNTDKKITVTDIAGIANIILTGGSSAAKSRTAKFASKSVNPSLEIVPFTIAQGVTTKTVPLELISEKEGEYVGFQCDIYLPDGISWEKNSRGKLKVPTFNAEADRTSTEYHTASAAAQEDGSIRVLCYSNENLEILGKDGAVLDLPLAFDENLAPGVYDIVISNLELTNTNIEAVNPTEYKVSVLVGSPDIASISLFGDFTAEAIAEYNTALADNKSIAAVDLTGAFAIDTETAFDFGNNNLLIYIADDQTVANDANVIKDGVCANLILIDGNDFYVPKAFTAAQASYTRAIANSIGTICLPFAVKSTDEIQYYQLSEVDMEKEVLTFDEVNGLDANQPGVFQMLNGGNLTINVSNAEITPVEDMCIENCGWILNGVFVNTIISKDLFAEHDYYYIANNKFCSVIETKDLTIGTFRAYFTTNSSSNVKSFSIAIGNETAITNVSIDEAVNDKAYNVAGLPVNGNYKGLVIKNGKKYLNK